MGGQSDFGRFASKESGAEGVESGDVEFNLAWKFQQANDALLHFIGGFISERGGKDAPRGDVFFFDKVSNFMSDDAGFAAARAGDNKLGTVRQFNGFPLHGVEFI